MKRNIKSIKIFFSLILFIVFLPLTQVDGAMYDYCVTPPFITQSIPPNILIVQDNSGSMNCLAYTGGYNPTQFNTGYYYGYFDPTKNYKYTTGSTADLPSRWVPTTAAITTGTAANPIASGNFLNWATMSRHDVAKRIMIGGKASKGATYAGAYDVADRSTTNAATKPVKLYAEGNPGGGNSCSTDDKSYDTGSKKCSSNLAETCTTDSDCTAHGGGTCDYLASPLIYPFDGDYKYTMTSNGSLGPRSTSSAPYNQGILNIAFNDPTTVKLYPNSNFSSTNPAYTFPAAWVKTGTGSAYQVVDETTANTTDYIQNKSSTEPALFGYDHTNAALVGASGTISSVTVYAYARKYGSNTVNLQAVLQLKDSSADLVSASGLSALTTSYVAYTFTFATNPQTGVAWEWADLTGSAVGSVLGFGVKASKSLGANPTTSDYPSVSQVYIQINVSSPTLGGPYNIIVDQGATAASGVLDTMSTGVRYGLAIYNATTQDGAKVVDYVDGGATSGLISSISSMIFNSYTPLSETLYEMTRYFRQDSTNYLNTDYIKGCSSATNGTSSCTGIAPTSKDPYYFSDAGRYVPCVKSFILFLTDGESTFDQNIPGTSTSSPYAACSLTNIKACSGFGIPDADGSTAGVQRFGGTTIGATYTGSGTDYLIDVAYWAHTNDMRYSTDTDVPTTWRQGLPGKQTITLYPVYLFGTGSTLLKDAAIYGGFNDLNSNNKPDCTATPKECYRDSDSDGVVSSDGSDDPITYFEGDDGYKLEASITNALSDILRQVTSGTAASVLASGEGSGANLIQATYYPRRQFGNDTINWIGSLQNLWYYVDPFFTFSNIREEGGQTKDYILNLFADGSSDSNMDYVLQLYYDTDDKKARARRFYDELGTGMTGTGSFETIDFENLGNLWNAGPLLWSRDLSSSPRTIKTWLDKDSDGIVDTGEYVDFSTTAFIALSAGDKTVLGTSLQAADDTAASKTISYINGYDKFCTGTATPCAQDSDCISPVTCSGSGYRSRTVAVDLNGDGDTIDAGESAKVWKLGDIINSTPQISSWLQLNGYDNYYADSSYKAFVNDTGSTLPAASTARYKNRGMVFVGANDGMLHAFKLGKLGLHWTSQTQTQKATLGKYCADFPGTACVISSDCPSGACTSDTDLGKEVWAFIPKNVLPYLKYTYDTSYCHVTSVDLAPYIFDASIEGPATACTALNYWDCPKNVNSWRTILIGGMKYGGACKAKDVNCSTNTPNGVCAPTEVGGASVGYSSYFALDITDPYNPQLLWEFSNSDLGFTSAGPAIVRISSRTAGGSSSTADDPKTTNGRWFVVFASGPTGGIDTLEKQFLGNSDQPLRLFILDLKTGSLTRTINTGIANAFAGSMLNSAQDSDLDYQDDVVYIPYVRKCILGDTAAICDSSGGKWNNGGVLRLLTNEDLAGGTVSSTGNTALNPANWQYSLVIDDAGPVTSSVVRLQDKKSGKLWLYFGTGRYFYKLSTNIDDSDKVRHLYGLKDPCFNGGAFSASCLGGTGDSYTSSQLASVVTTTTGGVTDNEGWKISMDDCTSVLGTTVACTSAYYKTERVITNPLTTSTGVVFFTTLKPFDDICSSGGNSAIWAVKYDTGGAPGTLLQGKALIQVSTGAIEQMDLSTAFTEKSGRKTGDIQGVPPTSQGLSIMSQPAPIKRVIHMRER